MRENLNYSALANTFLFRGASRDEIEAMLDCLGGRVKRYQKGEIVYRAGEVVSAIGLVLSGGVSIESDDFWGNKSVLAHVGAGHIFAETYALIPGEPLMINVVAIENSEILFLNASRLITTCPNSCAHHQRLVQSLLHLTAQKNIGLSRRILHTSSKTIRGRLLSYLSEQAKQSGGQSFEIPFNRQQLADYLGVDRSALSGELSKMQRDGIIAYSKNSFTLLDG